MTGRRPARRATRSGDRDAWRVVCEALRGCGADDEDVLRGMAAAASDARATKRAAGRADDAAVTSDDVDGGTGDCGGAGKRQRSTQSLNEQHALTAPKHDGAAAGGVRATHQRHRDFGDAQSSRRACRERQARPRRRS
jgi:hypothetical protein